MKKISILCLIIIVLTTGCNSATKSNKEVNNKNEKTLVCTKVFGTKGSCPYTTVADETLVYEDDALKSITLSEKYNFTGCSYTLADASREELFDFFEHTAQVLKCSKTHYNNNSIFKDTVKECTTEWDDNYLCTHTYNIDVEKVKDNENLKTIEDAQDFFEYNLHKCEVK